MPGGHFHYAQFKIEDIASEIDEIIASNYKKDEFGYMFSFSAETIKKFREAAQTLRRAEEMTNRIDWLVSGDDDQENFHRRWNKKGEKNDVEIV